MSSCIPRGGKAQGSGHEVVVIVKHDQVALGGGGAYRRRPLYDGRGGLPGEAADIARTQPTATPLWEWAHRGTALRTSRIELVLLDRRGPMGDGGEPPSARPRPRGGSEFCLNHGMDAETAARRWADTWSRAWPQRDAEAIAALYAGTAVYRSPAFRQPYSGLAGVRRYLGENLPAEENIECWFGEPIVSGDRAAVEWWGSWREQGQELTFAGVTRAALRRPRQSGRPSRLRQPRRAARGTVRRLVTRQPARLRSAGG